MKGKIISKEIKEEVLEKIKNGEKINELANLYGLGQKTIYNWLTKQSNQVSSLELGKLRRENETLKILLGEFVLEKSKRKKNNRSQRYA
jgi:transposase